MIQSNAALKQSGETPMRISHLTCTALLALAIATPAFATPKVDCHAWQEAVQPIFDRGAKLPEMPLITAIDWADEALKILDEAKTLDCVSDLIQYTKTRTEIINIRLDLKTELARRMSNTGKEVAGDKPRP